MVEIRVVNNAYMGFNRNNTTELCEVPAYSVPFAKGDIVRYQDKEYKVRHTEHQLEYSRFSQIVSTKRTIIYVVEHC